MSGISGPRSSEDASGYPAYRWARPGDQCSLQRAEQRCPADEQGRAATRPGHSTARSNIKGNGVIGRGALCSSRAAQQTIEFFKLEDTHTTRKFARAAKRPLSPTPPAGRKAPPLPPSKSRLANGNLLPNGDVLVQKIRPPCGQSLALADRQYQTRIITDWHGPSGQEQPPPARLVLRKES